MIVLSPVKCLRIVLRSILKTRNFTSIGSDGTLIKLFRCGGDLRRCDFNAKELESRET